MSITRKDTGDNEVIISTSQFAENELQDADDVADIEDIRVQPHCDLIIGPTYSIPVVNAGLGSVKSALGLVERNNSYPIIIGISSVNFLVMLGMNLRYTMDGIKGTLSYLRYRTIPKGWAEITPAKNRLALTMTFLTSISKSGTDAILNRYFIMRLPVKFNFTNSINMTGWEAFGWTMGGFTFAGSLASGSMAMYVKMRNVVFGDVKPDYSNKFSRYFSPVVGTTLSLTYAVSNLSGNIVSMTHTFGITSAPGIACVFGLGVVNAVNGQFTNLPFNVNAVDKFCGIFTPKEGELPAYKNPYSVVSFTVAMSAAGLIGYSSRALSSVLLNQSLITLGVNYTAITDPIVEGISDVTILCNILWVGGALTPLFYDIFSGFVGLITTCVQRMHEDGDMQEVESLLADSDDDENDDVKVEVVDDEQAARQQAPGLQAAPFRMYQSNDNAANDVEYQHQKSCGIM